jgi:predicted alpha/beta superfamily hydrolase
MKLHVVTLLVLISSLSSLAQRKDFDLFSKELNENQTIWVQLPEHYDASTAYGVLYVLDADGHFDYMTRYVNYLSKPFAKVIPELIVVGIRSKSPAYRYKNFTPAGANKPEQGNADHFISFLKDEVIPEINKKFKTTETRVLAGHSLAGLLALYTIHQSANTFTHVIAASPSLPYADGKLISLYEQKPSAETKIKLFFSIAENDLANYKPYSDKFKNYLEASDWKSWHYEFISDTDHYSTCPVAFYKGLIAVFK